MSLSGQPLRAIARIHRVQSHSDLRAHYMSDVEGVPFVPCIKKLMYLYLLSSNQRRAKVMRPPRHGVMPLSSSSFLHSVLKPQWINLIFLIKFKNLTEKKLWVKQVKYFV